MLLGRRKNVENVLNAALRREIDTQSGLEFQDARFDRFWIKFAFKGQIWF